MSRLRKKPVGITETILRDAHQSGATRMTANRCCHDYRQDGSGWLPFTMRMLGRSHFDACLRFWKEDPWGETS